MSGADQATAELLAEHTYDYTVHSAKKPVTVCLCRAETPLDLPGGVLHASHANIIEAERLAHATHLASVLADEGYRRLTTTTTYREIIVPAPNVPFKGGDHKDSHYMRTAARNLEKGYAMAGGNVTRTIIKLLRDTADSLDTPN